MTDNEIIKALENCMTPNNACGDCSLRKECDNNTRTLENYALALINRQNAKIEELQHKIMSCNSEIERLQGRVKSVEYSKQCLLECFKTAKSEARKEFAERLKEEVAHIPAWGRVAEKKIDNLLKEMESD